MRRKILSLLLVFAMLSPVTGIVVRAEEVHEDKDDTNIMQIDSPTEEDGESIRLDVIPMEPLLEEEVEEKDFSSEKSENTTEEIEESAEEYEREGTIHSSGQMHSSVYENGWTTFRKSEEEMEQRRAEIRKEVEDNRDEIYARQEELRAQGIKYVPRNSIQTLSSNNSRRLVGGYLLEGEKERLIYNVSLGERVETFSLWDLIADSSGGLYSVEVVEDLNTGEVSCGALGEWTTNYYTYALDITGITVPSSYFDSDRRAVREGSTKAFLDIYGCDLVIDIDQNGNEHEIYQDWEGYMAVDVLISREEEPGRDCQRFLRSLKVSPGSQIGLNSFTNWGYYGKVESIDGNGFLDANNRVPAKPCRGYVTVYFSDGVTKDIEVIVTDDLNNYPLTSAEEKYFADWYEDGTFQDWFIQFLAAATSEESFVRLEERYFDPTYALCFAERSVLSVDDWFSNSTGTPNLLPRAVNLIEYPTQLDLSEQDISGSIPMLSNPWHTLEINLSENYLTGRIPRFTGNTVSLNASGNRLTGIDDNKNSSLEWIDCAENFISEEEVANNLTENQVTLGEWAGTQYSIHLADPSQTMISVGKGEYLDDKLSESMIKIYSKNGEEHRNALWGLQFTFAPRPEDKAEFEELFEMENGKWKAVDDGLIDEFLLGFALEGQEVLDGSNRSASIILRVGNGGTTSDILWLKDYMSPYKEVVGNISLPTQCPGGSTIAWTSSNAEYLSETGRVKRSEYYKFNIPVVLTATMNRDGEEHIMKFPVRVMAFSNVPQNALAASAFNDTHSMAMVNGQLFSAGDNVRGQLGNGNSENASLPVEVVNYLEQPFSNVQKVSSGLGYSVILDEDGRVWSVGFNEKGQLGDGTNENRNRAVPVLGKNGNGFLRDFVDVSAGYKHALALKNDGSVWAWGHNSVGQLGDGSKVTTSIPVRVKGADNTDWLKDITAVSASASCSMALTADGNVVMWGNNDKGQLGDGTKKNRSLPVWVKGPNGTDKLGDIVSIATAEGCSLALDRAGYVWTWGGNQNGRLGDGTTTERLYPDKVLIADEFGGGELDHIVSITAGYYFNLALDSDGNVWAWGKNDFGQLGNSTTDDQYKAVLVKGFKEEYLLRDITMISAGRGYAMATQKDGKVLAWGNNAYGQFGVGSSGQKFFNPIFAFTDMVIQDLEELKKRCPNMNIFLLIFFY